MRDFLQIARAWSRDERKVLDELSAPERRALGLIASGAGSEDELVPAGPDFVRGLKLTELPRAHAASGPQLEGRASNVIPWVLSTEDVNRHGDIVRQVWELDNYKKNPVVLWGHGYESDVPIARCINLRVEKKQLVGDVEFAVAESEFAAQIWRLVVAGFITAGSVGFRPKKVTSIADEEERQSLGLGRFGVIIERSELLEFSICAVPANPDALRNALQSGTIKEGDGILLAAPTERDLVRHARELAQRVESTAPPEQAVDDHLLAVLNTLSARIEEDARAREDHAASNRMLARAITDLGGRLRAVDAAHAGTGEGREAPTEDAIRKAIRSML